MNELFSHLATMNYYKQIFNQEREMQLQLCRFIQDHFEDIHNKHELAFGYMNFLVSIIIDVKDENYEKERRKLDLDREEFPDVSPRVIRLADDICSLTLLEVHDMTQILTKRLGLQPGGMPVSYTHLTLPTILRV